MFEWLRRKSLLRGHVLFRSALAPAVAGFDHLAGHGLMVNSAKAAADEQWRLVLAHPDWGEAVLSSLRNFEPPPRELIDHVWLSEAEKADLRSAESAALVEMKAPGDNILRERKTLLRFLNAAMGPDAVGVYDEAAMRPWSRAELADELCHDADLDVMSLLSLHAVTEDEGDEAVWIHSHGLGALGLVDFDFVQPAPGLAFNWNIEAERALAFAILEGSAVADSGPLELTYPGDPCRLVQVERFLDAGVGHGANLLRKMIEPGDWDHRNNRLVVCEAGRGLLGGLLPGRPRALAFLWDDTWDGGITYLSSETTNLMAARARATFDVLRSMYDEFSEFEPGVLAKLGYERDNSEQGDREHLWFEVHGLEPDALDATLLNDPYDIAAIKQGDRARHPSDRLTDWTIFTPVGKITPQSFVTARMIRENPEGVREIMRSAQDAE